MEPVTHVLTGACLSRAGLNRRAAYATVAMAIAAEFPDIDTIWGLRGPVSGFAHHRGITHSFIGVPFEAALIVAGFWAYHRFRYSDAANVPGQVPRAPRPAAPVRWPALYGFVLLALLSHLLLDYTNNYGIRPFLPFDGRWFAGSIVFIFDPLIFLCLVAALIMPALFGFIGREVGARRERFRGRGWARAMLVAIVLLWSVRWLEHRKAVALADLQTLRAPGDAGVGANPQPGMDSGPAPEESRSLLQPIRSVASPDPLSVFRWYTATDFGPAYRLGVADTHVGAFSPGQILNKPDPSPAITAAETSFLGEAYLDWSPMPVLAVDPGAPAEFEGPDQSTSSSLHTVTFRDPRFMAQVPLLHREGDPPLSGQVVLDQQNRVVAQGMDGRFGR